MRAWFIASPLIVALIGMLPAPVSAAETVGVVLMHGKLGMPLGMSRGKAGPPIGGVLISKLKETGYRVTTPEMCWSRARGFDKTYPDCLAEIDSAIAALKAEGATVFVVAGMSLGGNAAIAYGTAHPDLLGVVVLSPADDPNVKKKRMPGFQDQIDAAQKAMDEGRGNERTGFEDRNTGAEGGYGMSLSTTPAIYLSFNGLDSLTVIPRTIAKLSVPLLWIAGSEDPTQAGGQTYAFDNAPANPANRYVAVRANHVEVPDEGAGIMLDWLAQRNAAKP